MMTLLRELVLDTKGIRRVRTPAGVRYFGLPIGSIITRDVRDRAKARHTPKRRKNTRKAQDRHRPQGRISEPRLHDETPKTKTGPIERGDRVVSGGSVGTVIRPERKYRQDGFVVQFTNPDNPSWGSHPRWVPANGTHHASDDDEKKMQGGRKRAEYLQSLAEQAKKKKTEKPASTLTEVAKKPTPRSRAKKAPKIEPSADTKAYIDEMRGFHDTGWAGWDNHLGTERDVGKIADRAAERYDKNNARIEELLIDEEEAKIEFDEDGTGTGKLSQWAEAELQQLRKENELLFKDAEDLADLADLKRDLTAKDIPKRHDFGRSDYVIRRIQDGPEAPDKKREMIALYLNHMSTNTPDRDKNGRAVPPQSLLDARDDFHDLGVSMLKEIRAHYDSDSRVLAARKALAEIDGNDPRPELDMNKLRSLDYDRRRHMTDKWHKEIKEWYKRQGIDDEGYAATREFDDKRQMRVYAAQQQLARAERDVKLEYLNTIRPMGTHPEATPRFVGNVENEQEWDEMAHEALSIFPTAWIAAFPDKWLERKWSNRAYFNGPNPGTFDPENPGENRYGYGIGLRVKGQEVPPDYANTSFSGYSVESSAHEMMHGMEAFIPGLTGLEWAEIYDRTGRHDPEGTWEKPKTQNGMQRGEPGFMDDLANPYAGRDYAGSRGTSDRGHREHWELFTTGVQDMFGRSSQTKKYTKPEDDKVEALILAAMATLHYYDDEEDYRK